MEGGIALFLLFVIIVVALVLAVVFGGLGGGTQALNEWRERRRGPRRQRPTHTVVRDDGPTTGQHGERL